MGGRIRQLPDGVIDQIAAGEVVERPSSSLKELLENAVDASASRIEAQVFGAFPFSLRVSDDGTGMTAEEAEVAVRRHTTSKIAAADDLQKLSTYGVRGGAPPPTPLGRRWPPWGSSPRGPPPPARGSFSGCRTGGPTSPTRGGNPASTGRNGTRARGPSTSSP